MTRIESMLELLEYMILLKGSHTASLRTYSALDMYTTHRLTSQFVIIVLVSHYQVIFLDISHGATGRQEDNQSA